MLDNQLIILLMQQMTTALALINQDLPIQSANQPSLQGVPTEPTYILTLVSTEVVGWPGRNDTLNDDETAFIHTDITQLATTMQLGALAIQDPADTNQLTANDLLQYARWALQSDGFVSAMEAQGVGVQAVLEVRNPYFQDDRDIMEASPSFDFVLTHKQIIVTSTPLVQSEELRIYDV